MANSASTSKPLRLAFSSSVILIEHSHTSSFSLSSSRLLSSTLPSDHAVNYHYQLHYPHALPRSFLGASVLRCKKQPSSAQHASQCSMSHDAGGDESYDYCDSYDSQFNLSDEESTVDFTPTLERNKKDPPYSADEQPSYLKASFSETTRKSAISDRRVSRKQQRQERIESPSESSSSASNPPLPRRITRKMASGLREDSDGSTRIKRQVPELDESLLRVDPFMEDLIDSPAPITDSSSRSTAATRIQSSFSSRKPKVQLVQIDPTWLARHRYNSEKQSRQIITPMQSNIPSNSASVNSSDNEDEQHDNDIHLQHHNDQPSDLNSISHFVDPDFKQEYEMVHVPGHPPFQIRSNWGYKKLVAWWDTAMNKFSNIVDNFVGLECIVDIRDARMPVSGTHPLIQRWVDTKGLKHIVLYTHEDLLTEKQTEAVREWTRKALKIPDEQIFFEDLRDHKTRKATEIQNITQLITKICLAKGTVKFTQIKRALVAGVPNVGKSSFIYIACAPMIKEVKKKQMYHAPNIKDYAGVTVSVKSHWMSQKPNIMLVDTPGLFPPYWELEKDPERVYKLACTTSFNIKDTEDLRNGVKVVEVADYLLWRFNKAGNFRYIGFYNMRGPTDDINTLLEHVEGKTSRAKAVRFIQQFNEGHLGRMILDDLSVDEEKIRLAKEETNRRLSMKQIVGGFLTEAPKKKERKEVDKKSWKLLHRNEPDIKGEVSGPGGALKKPGNLQAFKITPSSPSAAPRLSEPGRLRRIRSEEPPEYIYRKYDFSKIKKHEPPPPPEAPPPPRPMPAIFRQRKPY